MTDPSATPQFSDGRSLATIIPRAVRATVERLRPESVRAPDGFVFETAPLAPGDADRVVVGVRRTAGSTSIPARRSGFRRAPSARPEHNAAQPVVSNARGAARRFLRPADALRVTMLPETSIPALPMIAVNEEPSPVGRLVTGTETTIGRDPEPDQGRRSHHAP
jgi:hypothetical protein